MKQETNNMAFGVLGAMFAVGPSPHPKPRKVDEQARITRERDFDTLKESGFIRDLGAIAINPPMNPWEAAYYHGSAGQKEYQTWPTIPSEPPATRNQIALKVEQLRSGHD